jgi:hypothetical protein
VTDKPFNIDELAREGSVWRDVLVTEDLPDIALARFGANHFMKNRVELKGKIYRRTYDERGILTGRVKEET